MAVVVVVAEMLPRARRPPTDRPSRIRGATLDRDFGYQPTAPTFSVSGNVWHDNGQGGGIAGDGFKNGGEANLPTVKVTVSVDADGAGGNPPVLYTVFTDASGNYLLNGVPGTALVVITVDPTTLPNASFVQTGDPDVIKDNQNTFTMANANVTGKNFGYRSVLASIAGTVVRNADGSHGQLSIQWQTLAPRQIALMRLPRLLVHFQFDGLNDAQRYAFMRRFDLYMQRGGG